MPAEGGTSAAVERWVDILGDVEPREVREGIARCLSGEISPPLGVTRALVATANLDRVKVTLELVGARLLQRRDPEALRRCREMARLLPRNAKVRAGLRALLRESGELFARQRETDEAIAACRAYFDRAVGHSEEASVALCSLGDPFLLARATAEVVDLFHRLRFVGKDRDILQIGCGTGRFEAAFSGSVRRAVGIDVSPRMIEVARRRCAGLANVSLEVTSGQDLSRFEDASFDLVYAVDTFPYLVLAGEAVVDAHFRDARRVLRPGGDFVICNYSYRSDLDRDRKEVAERAQAFGFEVVRQGEKPFLLWDALVFHLRAA